jgi:hypothetical protein
MRWKEENPVGRVRAEGANQTELRSFSNVVRILIPGVRIFFGRMRPAWRDLLWKKLLTIRSHTAVARWWAGLRGSWAAQVEIGPGVYFFGFL